MPYYFHLDDYGNVTVSTHVDFHPEHYLDDAARLDAIDALIVAIHNQFPDFRDDDEPGELAADRHDVLGRLRDDFIDALARDMAADQWGLALNDSPEVDALVAALDREQ